MAAAELSEEIILEILAKLPVETLIRFRSVSKSWQALITSPSFINQHLYQSSSMISFSSSSTFLALVYPHYMYGRMLSFLVTIDKARRLTSMKQLDLPDQKLAWNWMQPTLLGCGCGCCGVFCVADMDRDKAVVWNPATRETRKLPPCPFFADPARITYKFVAFSCSMDQKNNKKVRDFKLMRLLLDFNEILAAPVLQVYTMSTNTWRVTTESHRKGGLEYSAISKLVTAHFNGVVNSHNKSHWVVKSIETRLNAVLFFNFEKDYFGLFQVPPELARSKIHNVFLTLFDSKFLCLIERTKRQKFDVWVMREYDYEEEHCNWVRHSVVQLEEKISSKCLHTWSPVVEDGTEGISGLYFHGKEVYFCSKLGFSRNQTGFTPLSSEVVNIANNVSSLLSLEHVHQ